MDDAAQPRATETPPSSEPSESCLRDDAVARNTYGTSPSSITNPTQMTAGGPEEVENPDRPTGFRFVIVYSCILMGDFFTGYDTSCVTTLTPAISNEFHAIDDVAWYGIAYILAATSTVLLFGQIYTLYPMKAVFLTSFFIFAAGSAVSATAPSSAVFILGRALSGLGSAGVFSGGSIIVANTTPLKHRPIYQGICGGMECTALALGPLVAGAIAHASFWRAAFYVIVPVSLANIVAMSFWVKSLPQPENVHLNTKKRFRELDLLGMLFFVPTMVCFILALQWGGSTYAWSDGRIVALLTMAGIFAIIFGVTQHFKGDKAMLPFRLFMHRSVSLGALTQFSVSGALFAFGFYLPIYFQAVRGASTLTSGLMYLPTALPFAIAIFGAGNITSLIGYYTPVMLAGTIPACIAAGLTTTFQPDTPSGQWIGYQIMIGVGTGLIFQQSYTAVQTVLPEKNVATALVVLNFTQEIGGIVVLAVSQNVFLKLLTEKLLKIVPGLDKRTILDKGLSDLVDSIPQQYRPEVIDAYNQSIVAVFCIGLICAVLTLCGLGIEWRSVKQEKKESGAMSEETGLLGEQPPETA